MGRCNIGPVTYIAGIYREKLIAGLPVGGLWYQVAQLDEAFAWAIPVCHRFVRIVDLCVCARARVRVRVRVCVCMCEGERRTAVADLHGSDTTGLQHVGEPSIWCLE